MNEQIIRTLADIIKEYFSPYELEELCIQNDVELAYSGNQPNLLILCSDLMGNLSSARSRKLLDILLDDLFKRCYNQMQNPAAEDNLYHQQVMKQLKGLRSQINDSTMLQERPRAASTGALTPAGSYLIDFFSQADTPVTIVDTDLGPGSLECLRKVQTRIRLLTRKQSGGPGNNFMKALNRYLNKGMHIQLREHGTVNDRCIIFNDRCWLAGSSLINAGQSGLPMVEIVDFKDLVIRLVEKRWKKANAIVLG